MTESTDRITDRQVAVLAVGHVSMQRLPAPSITVCQLDAPDVGYVEAPAATGELVTTAPLRLRIDIPALVVPHS